jgi:hypothetical protein
MKDFYTTLSERYPDGNYTDDQLWEVMVEVHNVAQATYVDEYMGA